MKCPQCNETLVMTDRQGVEIDYCPNCRGVWLDRGELDKIIERSANYVSNPVPDPDAPQSHPHHDGQYNDPQHRKGSYYKDDPNYRYKDDPNYKHKKKKGFLDDFFDF